MPGKNIDPVRYQALMFQSLLPTLYFAAAALHAAHDRGLVPEWDEAGHLPPTVLFDQLTQKWRLCFKWARLHLLGALSARSFSPSRIKRGLLCLNEA